MQGFSKFVANLATALIGLALVLLPAAVVMGLIRLIVWMIGA